MGISKASSSAVNVGLSPDQRTRLVWALALSQLVSWGSLYYSFSLFVVPMEQELGWSRVELTGALALGLLVAGLAAPFVGARIDRDGGRRLMVAGSILGSLMLTMWAWSPTLPVFYLVWFGLGLSQAMTLYEPALAVLNRELDAGAPAAIARITILGGLARTLFFPLTQVFIEIGGWRFAALMLAAMNLLICAPLHALAVPGGRCVGAKADGRLSLLPVLKRATGNVAFWALLCAYASSAFVTTAITFHLVPLLLGRGFDSATAVRIMALIGPMQVLGRLGFLAFGRNHSIAIVGLAVMLAMPAAVALLLADAGGVALLIVFAALYGVSEGLTTIVRGVATAEFLGRQRYGSLSGLLATPTAVARALSPATAGAVWVAAGGYGAVLWILMLSAFLAAAAFGVASVSSRRTPLAQRAG